MPWNGSGTFTRTNGDNTGANLWQQDEAEGIGTTASRFDTHDQDIATAINNCMTLDGQNAATANQNFGGYRATNAAVATAATDLIRTSQVQNSSVIWGGTAANTADALTISVTPALTAYVAGQQFAFVVNADNTGAATLNVNNLGARALNNVGLGLRAKDLISSMVVHVIYDGTTFQMLNPVERQFQFTSITAAGDSQATATALTGTHNLVTTDTATKGVILPAATEGRVIHVVNEYNSTATLQVYPASGEYISNLAVNTPLNAANTLAIAIGRLAIFTGYTNRWYYTS